MNKLQKRYKKYCHIQNEKGKVPRTFDQWLERHGNNLSNTLNEGPRTIQNFVEDMISEGKSLEHIKVVAYNTYWRPQLPAIMDTAKIFMKNLKISLLKLSRPHDNIIRT